MVGCIYAKCGSQIGGFLRPALRQCPTCRKIRGEKVPEAEGRAGVQEAGLPALPDIEMQEGGSTSVKKSVQGY
jgi:hypothetical protein